MATLEKKIDFGFAGYKKTSGTIILHFKEGATAPHAAEVFTNDEDGDYHTEYGLWFEQKAIEGWDAAGYWTFGLPAPLADWLRELGYKVESIHIA
jgi:hypothetical protein